MGDDLAQILFETLQARGEELPPFRKVTWDELSLADRGMWEAVAQKARVELGLRFRRDMRDARAQLGAEEALANLLEDN